MHHARMHQGERITYDSVTIHFKDESEEPVTIDRVIDLVESRFPGSGDRALQVLDDPSKGPALGLFEARLLLFRPDEIDRIVLQEGEAKTTASVEETVG